MAPEYSVESLLAKLTASLESVTSVLPDNDIVVSTQDGISLLDVKTELLLSYLQNLVFLVLVKIRHSIVGANSTNTLAEGEGQEQNGDSDAEDANIGEEVVKKLVELRLYLEKGVKPLESKLKYQIDKVLRAADTLARDAAQPSIKGPVKQTSKATATGSDSGSEDSSDDASSAEIDSLAYRPNPAAFTTSASAHRTDSRSTSQTAATAKQNGVYKPPRITPTALPQTLPSEKRDKARKPPRSGAIDDYIASELSSAPIAEPSIGSTIIHGGRRTKSARDREVEDERKAYEEANFVRLAPESRKDRLKRGAGGRSGNVYGGEEMAGLGAGVERIERVTGGKRKGRMTEDGPRGEGFDGKDMKRRKVGRR